MRPSRVDLISMIDNILITTSLPSDEVINTLAKKCYEEVPSFGAWDLDICYATEGLESNHLITSFKERFMQAILFYCNSELFQKKKQ